ncbi:MAG: rod shape-determining protein MreD [Gammaproteobacteria bacterium]|nr:rod shape-determining protein MreD [Gammaproteobacteria bacterium]
MARDRRSVGIVVTMVLAVLATASYQSLTQAVNLSWLYLLPTDWVTLVVFYWTTTQPTRLNFVLMWIIGFVLDELYQHPLGLNGICLAAIVYIGSQIFDVYYEDYENRMLVLMFAMLTIISSVKVSLLVVLLNLEFNWIHVSTILVTLTYALFLLPCRKLTKD